MFSQNDLKFILQLCDNDYFNIYSRFSVKYFFQPILYRLCKLHIFLFKTITFIYISQNRLNQIKPNLAGITLGGTFSELCLTNPPCIQDGGCYLKSIVYCFILGQNKLECKLKLHDNEFSCKKFHLIDLY